MSDYSSKLDPELTAITLGYIRGCSSFVLNTPQSDSKPEFKVLSTSQQH